MAGKEVRWGGGGRRDSKALGPKLNNVISTSPSLRPILINFYQRIEEGPHESWHLNLA